MKENRIFKPVDFVQEKKRNHTQFATIKTTTFRCTQEGFRRCYCDFFWFQAFPFPPSPFYLVREN
jgi:hypothetical protein